MNRRRYQFRGGGLIPKPPTFAKKLGVPEGFRVPAYIDNSPYCLPSSNQGAVPACAGYAVAGAIEVWNWQMRDVYEQVNGVAILQQAHKSEGVDDPEAGTTLDRAADAAQTLGLMPKCRIVRLSSLLEVQHALHRNVVCVVGFNITEEWNYVDIETGSIANKANPGPLGGHAVLLCGYNEMHRFVEWQNSWGDTWGRNGVGRMSYDQFGKQFMYGIALELP